MTLDEIKQIKITRENLKKINTAVDELERELKILQHEQKLTEECIAMMELLQESAMREKSSFGVLCMRIDCHEDILAVLKDIKKSIKETKRVQEHIFNGLDMIDGRMEND